MIPARSRNSSPTASPLSKRLLWDPRVPRRVEVALALLISCLVLPFDVVPDFMPVVGQLDDAILVAVTMAYVMRQAGREVVAGLWPGSERGLQTVLGLAEIRL